MSRNKKICFLPEKKPSTKRNGNNISLFETASGMISYQEAIERKERKVWLTSFDFTNSRVGDGGDGRRKRELFLFFFHKGN